MRRLLPFTLLLLACEPPLPDVAATEAPIVDGTFEPGEDAVVVVTAFGAAGLCTGTLIAPNVVLTAKHCVQAPNMDAPYPVTAFTVGVGSRVGDTRNFRARYVDTTPGVYTQSSTTGLAGEIFGVDVALLILREAPEGVTPIPIRRERPDDRIGQEFTAIGFGRRPDGAAGSKYRTTGILQSVTETGILFSEQVICSGDSGGPMIQEAPERRVIGVASFGEAGACPSSRDGYNAVWNHLDRVDRALVLGGNCLGLEETCNSLDDDCDGTIDEGCAALGASCGDSSECANAQLPGFLDPLDSPVECVDTGAGSVCTRRCDASRPRASCAALEGFDDDVPVDGFYCRRDGCDGYCVAGDSGDAPDGSECAGDTECRSLLCTDPGDGAQRCRLPCRPGQGECPVGEVCVGAGATCGACVDGGLVTGGRSIGEPCSADTECAGTCLDGYCTDACSPAEPCVDGFTCVEGTCHRGGVGRLGDPCEDDTQCQPGTFCAEQGGRRWCAGLCEDDPTICPPGMECVDAGGRQLCAPSESILGESCSDTCAASTCEADTCTRACGAGEHCPTGFECARDPDGNARCRAPSSGGGGCAIVANGPSSAPLAALLGLLAIAMLRRSRRNWTGVTAGSGGCNSAADPCRTARRAV